MYRFLATLKHTVLCVAEYLNGNIVLDKHLVNFPMFDDCKTCFYCFQVLIMIHTFTAMSMTGGVPLVICMVDICAWIWMDTIVS